MARRIAALLAVVGILGVILLTFDKSLQQYAPSHFDALIAFVVIDFALAALIVIKPRRTTLTLVVGWSLLRIILQIGDVLLGSNLGFQSNAQFANYLFNPLYPVEGNPPGVPGALLDVMLLLQLATIGLGWRARKRIT